MALPNLTQPGYLPQLTNSNDGLQGLLAMMHSFLGLVQPNSFPDFLPQLINREINFTNPDFYKEVNITAVSCEAKGWWVAAEESVDLERVAKEGETVMILAPTRASVHIIWEKAEKIIGNFTKKLPVTVFEKDSAFEGSFVELVMPNLLQSLGHCLKSGTPIVLGYDIPAQASLGCNIKSSDFILENSRRRGKSSTQFTLYYGKVGDVLVYQAGFLVCIIIGALFIILMPLVGLCFCCCRCCGNCGGRMYQKQKNNTGCHRQAFFASVLAVTAILLAGDICAFVSNDRMSQSVNKSFSAFNSTMDNLQIFLSSIPQEVDFIIDSSSVPIQQTNISLQDIGKDLGGKIVRTLSGRAHAVLNTAEQLFQVINAVEQDLRNVSRAASDLQALQKELALNLTTLREDINKTLSNCGSPCQNVSVKGLAVTTNFSMVPDVQHPLQLIGNVTQLNPIARLEEANKTLNNIPANVSEQAKKVVSEGQAHLDSIKQKIAEIRSSLPIQNMLGNVSGFLGDVTEKASTYEPNIETYDRYRRIVGICLCCLVLLIIVLNALGLLFGALGLDSQAAPTKRGCLSNSGGDFLMAQINLASNQEQHVPFTQDTPLLRSVGFSFIFAWLLMLLVLLTFLVGGNVYTIVCRPWATGRLLQFLDTPGLFPELNLSRSLGIKDSNVTLASVYKNCKNNNSLWNTLHLGETVSLDDTLNISRYTHDINSTLKNLKIKVEATKFLTDDQKSSLKDLGIKDESLNLNFTGTLQQINQNMTQKDLSDFVKQLHNLADRIFQENETISRQLRNQANSLKEIQSRASSSFSAAIQTLNSSIWQLHTSVPQTQELVNSTLAKVEEAERFMTNHLGDVVANATWGFVHGVLGYFEVYLDWVKDTITGEVARCGPAAWTLDAANTIVCSYIVDNWNAFWFSLGWCTIFLLPSVILAVHLAKFYRRMHTDDIYEGNGEIMELSRPSHAFKMPRPEVRK